MKALFSVANNTVMSYAGQQGIVEGLMDQDLVVVFENWMTPTAQLADYVLPGDMWAERDLLGQPGSTWRPCSQPDARSASLSARARTGTSW